MKRRTTRSILVGVISMWALIFWAMGVAAIANPQPGVVRQSCLPGGPPPVGCPSPSGTSSGSASPSGSPSGSSSPSSSPSESPEPEPQDSASKITIKYGKKQFSGAVTSSRSCENGRNVTLHRLKGGKARNVGKTRTAPSGKWKIAYPKPGGKKYYAKVKQSKAGETTCKGARSKTIRA